MYFDINNTGKAGYSEKLSVFDEDYAFGFKYDSSASAGGQFRNLLRKWTVPAMTQVGAISYVYIQPYTSTTLIKGESKIEILGVNFA